LYIACIRLIISIGNNISTSRGLKQMTNMSYCRFQNTLKDLRDCWGNWDDEPESEEEKRAKEQLAKLCKLIAEDTF
jgi:hypothetical protein